MRKVLLLLLLMLLLLLLLLSSEGPHRPQGIERWGENMWWPRPGPVQLNILEAK